MDVTMVVLRLVHVVLGIFWVGTMLFNTIFLIPAMRDAGPDASKVQGGLVQRRMTEILLVVSTLTLISGLWLYWKISGGFQHAYIHSPTGAVFATGGLLAIIAYSIGVTVVRPAMLRAVALAQSAQATAADREAKLAEAARLRTRGMKAGKLVATLLTLTAAAMAIARYV